MHCDLEQCSYAMAFRISACLVNTAPMMTSNHTHAGDFDLKSIYRSVPVVLKHINMAPHIRTR
jgi:hypothetical protein